MSEQSDELPVTPEGHILLLLEESADKRTFSDYQNIHQCLNTMVAMYEEYREAFNQNDQGDLKEFLNWMDSFNRIECFQYNSRFNRYKLIPRNNLKLLFGEHEGDRPTTNGTSDARPNSLEDDDEEEEDQLDYDDDEECWDR